MRFSFSSEETKANQSGKIEMDSFIPLLLYRLVHSIPTTQLAGDSYIGQNQDLCHTETKSTKFNLASH